MFDWFVVMLLLLCAMLPFLRGRKPGVRVLGVWRLLYRRHPRLAARTLFRARGRSQIHQGHSWSGGFAEVYLDAEGHDSPGDVLATVLHEWAHITCGTGKHDHAHREAMRTWTQRVLGIAANYDPMETAIAAAVNANPPRPVRASWRRGGQG